MSGTSPMSCVRLQGFFSHAEHRQVRRMFTWEVFTNSHLSKQNTTGSLVLGQVDILTECQLVMTSAQLSCHTSFPKSFQAWPRQACTGAWSATPDVTGTSQL